MASGASASQIGQKHWDRDMWCECPGCPKCAPHRDWPAYSCAENVRKQDRERHPEKSPRCYECRNLANDAARAAITRGRSRPAHANGSGSDTDDLVAVLAMLQTALNNFREAARIMAAAIERSERAEAFWVVVGRE